MEVGYCLSSHLPHLYFFIPWHLAIEGFAYVTPSQPQTGANSRVVGPLHSTAIHSVGAGGGGNLFSSFEYSIDASTFSNVKASIYKILFL